MTSASQSRLEKLPAELRNHIYTFAVVCDTPIRILKASDRGKPWIPKAIEPPISATSRDIRNEVLPIFYAEITFVCGTFTDRTLLAAGLECWIDMVQPHLTLLRKLGTYSYHSANKTNEFKGDVTYCIARKVLNVGVLAETTEVLVEELECTCWMKAVQHESSTLDSTILMVMMRANEHGLVSRRHKHDITHNAACALQNHRWRYEYQD